MYVDCDAATLGAGAALLRNLGYVVIASLNAEVAVEIFAQHPVAAVVLCESIEGSQRENIARDMRMLKPFVPIVLNNGKDAISYGSPGHDTKPLDVLLTQLLRGNAAASAEGEGI